MYRNKPAKGAKARGFSLLELLVVMVILGLALTIVPPLFSGAVPTLTLKGAVRDMELALRQTRSRSITRNQPVDIRLVPDEAYYLIGNGSKKRYLPPDIRIDLDESLSDPELTSRRILRFFPDGSSSGGRITLSNKDQEYRLDVDWLTGRVRVREVENRDG